MRDEMIRVAHRGGVVALADGLTVAVLRHGSSSVVGAMA